MKILFFDDFKLGILKGDHVVDVSAIVADIPHLGPHDLINGLIAQFEQYRSKIEAFVRGATGVPVASVRIRPESTACEPVQKTSTSRSASQAD